MICICGGILAVKNIEEPPRILKSHEKILYDRVCDVECLNCGKVLYSQPYDFGSNLNTVKPTMPKK